MSGITSGVGVFSGINRNEIISQLLAIDARPKTLAQRRIAQLQGVQVGVVDITSRLGTLKSAAAKFSAGIFTAARAATSDDKVLTATAGNNAPAGTYSFLVDRLVSTQQVLTRGFTDSESSGIGATSFTFEPVRARLDRDTALAGLNGGQGVSRGKVRVVDSTGASATVDLSRVETVGEVLTAFADATGVRVRARVDGDRLVVEDAAGGAGSLRIEDAAGYTTATSLGIAGSASAPGAGSIVGARINVVGGATTLRSLNDGLGVQINTAGGLTNPDFRITARDGATFDIDIGDIYRDDTPPGATTAVIVKEKSAVTDLAGVIARINEQTAGKITASINAAGTGLRLVDNSVPGGGSPSTIVEELGGRTTAADLGISGSSSTGSLDGRRRIAGLNSVLSRNLNGGIGVVPLPIEITTRAGGTFNIVDLDLADSVSDILKAFSDQTGGAIRAELDQTGTGFRLIDTSSGGGAFTVTGLGATDLGLTAQADGSFRSARQQLQYIGGNTELSTINGGRGVGVGTLEIVNSYGVSRSVRITDSIRTFGELVTHLNGQTENLTFRINAKGDGIEVLEDTGGGGAGGQRISIRDSAGTVAKSLNLAATATAVGASNRIDGSFERTVAFAATDTLKQISEKINAAGVSATASVINDGGSGRPFRLSLTARETGLAGAFTLDTGALDAGLSTINEPRNSRVFYGSGDPARAILYSASTNAVTGLAPNVTLNLRAPSTSPVTVTVTKDADGVVTALEDFIKAFNETISRIDALSTYDFESNRRGALLGDSNSQAVRSGLLSIVQGPPLNVSSRYTALSQVGLTLGPKGQLKLDTQKFRAAFEEDPTAVADLVAAKTVPPADSGQQPISPDIPGATVRVTPSTTATSQGVLERLANFADLYIRSTDGVITRQNKTIDDQVKAQNARIADFDRRLESKRARLERQFIQMEQAIGQLQRQQGSLGSIASLSN